jgi:light-regulated signal transduction histidine kinase (bacteriophytochrome)
VKLANGWVLEYRKAVLDYLRGADESGLHHAYELGRNAIEKKIGILDVVAIQHELLTEILKDNPTGGDWQLEKLSEFFIESLSPYEMTQRGFQEANARLLKAKLAAESANRDLEAFSYSVAHDLRAPLRTINGFARMLMEDHGGRLDEEGVRLLKQVIAGALNMGRLIDDLLDFSRAGRAAMIPMSIDMSALVHEIIRDLLMATPERRIDIHIGPMIPAWGDRSLLRQALVNLVGNAIKYTGRKDVAKIEMGSTAGASEDTYWIKDNGAGFDMANAKKLFGVFQRLHSQKDFEGTGVGLALVQRIIERHGGRVWATAKVDEGATFSFTLPRKEEADAGK